MFALAELLRGTGSRVDMVLGAATETRLFGLLEGRRAADSLTVTTDDGTAGISGRVTDPCPASLPSVGQRSSTPAVRCRCSPLWSGGRRRGRPQPVCRRGGDGLRRRDLHDLCCRWSGRTGQPGWCAPARRAGLLRRQGAMGSMSAPFLPTPSAPRDRGSLMTAAQAQPSDYRVDMATSLAGAHSRPRYSRPVAAPRPAVNWTLTST